MGVVEEAEAAEEEAAAADASADETARQRNRKRRRRHVNGRVRESRASCRTHATVSPWGSL